MDLLSPGPGHDSTKPITFQDFEELVQRLYLPGSPQTIAQIQQTLQNIQRSPEGWALADRLLESQDANVRFFGALTFTIKINTDWGPLGDGSTELLERLLSWLIRLVSTGEGALVVRKLCSALVAFFLQSAMSWTHCVRHVVCCLQANQVVSRDTMEHAQISSEQINRLSISQTTTALWFAMTLVEEASKLPFDSIQTHTIKERVLDNLEDTVELLRYIFNLDPAMDERILQEGVKCYQSWVIYAQRVWSSKDNSMDQLKDLCPKIVELVEIPELFDVAQEFLSDVLTNSPAFLRPSDVALVKQMLCRPTAQSYSSSLQDGVFDSECVAYGRLLLSFGDAYVQDLAKNYAEPQESCIMDQLVGLLMCKGYAVAEDEICSQVIEFWITYVEHLVDNMYGSDHDRPSWINQAIQYLMKSIIAVRGKILVPPPNKMSAWDTETRVGFKAFRADVEEFIHSSYAVLGLELFKHFAELALQSMASQEWYHLEATLFCLNALAEALAEESIGDAILTELFSSGLFSLMTQNAAFVPPKTQATALDMIYRYTPFFQRHTVHLPQTLNFLFTCLKAPALGGPASKAIFEMCDTCRQCLTNELAAFLQQYEVIRGWNSVDSSAKEKVLGAVAAIIQAVSPDEGQIAPLSQLLHFVQLDVESCLRSLDAGRIEDAKAMGIHVLNSLARVGKAMRVPDEVPVELEPQRPLSTLWDQAEGQLIQQRIVHLYKAIFLPMKSEPDFVEATCQILRSGYTESVPGSFVFAPETTVDILLSCDISTPGIGFAFETAGMMLSSGRQKRDPQELSIAALNCFHHCLATVQALNCDPSCDPEVARSCIDFAEKLIPSYIETFFDPRLQQTVFSFFEFTLKCLTTAEIMPKRSSASFWAMFVQVHGQQPQIQQMVNQITQDFGPRLVQILINGIGGEAARSELDTLSEPLKKIVLKQPLAKQWMNNALSSDDFPAKQVGETEKRIWVQKIFNLRGARGTNLIVREFWMTCRGTSHSFAS